MARRIFFMFQFLLIILMISVRETSTKSVTGGDLIDGNEFLSFFIEHTNKNKDQPGKDNMNSKNSDSFYDENDSTTFKFDEDQELGGSILSIDSLLSKDDKILNGDQKNSPFYGRRKTIAERTQSNMNRKPQNPMKNIEGTTLSTDHEKVERNLDSSNIPDDAKDNNGQVVKLVTSGSKIIFLEEISPSTIEESSRMEINKLKKQNETLPRNEGVPMDTSIRTTRTTVSPTTAKRPIDDVQVISIRVSSTVGRAAGDNVQQKRPVNNQKPSVSRNHSEKSMGENNTLNDNNDMDDFINRSHKSEFSIEEADPVTQETPILSPISDSVNVESSNIHSIVAPPHSIVNEPSQQHDEAMTPLSIGTSRMQRKQDKLVPFQTVIYHDDHYSNNDDKGSNNNTHPRSISYSSIAQTVEELNTWKDFDEILDIKRNISKTFSTPNLNLQEDPAKIISNMNKTAANNNQQIYSEPAKFYSQPAKVYGEPAKFYSEPAKIYSEPARVYGQPEKVYSQPAKFYSEPSKVYSQPAKVYSEPARIYGEPSKVYWPPTTKKSPTQPPIVTSTSKSTDIIHGISTSTTAVPTNRNQPSRRIIFNLDKLPYDLLNAPEANKYLLQPDTLTRQKPEQSNGNNYHQEMQHREQYNRFNHMNQGQSSSSYEYHQQQHQPESGKQTIVNIAPSKHPHHHHHHHHRHEHNIDSLVTETPINYNLPSTVTQSPKEIYSPMPGENYENRESVNVMKNGNIHGIQPSALVPSTPTPSSSDDDSKVGYVVEGRNYRKYRVEEKTSDGFIVGEYGVVSHNDGSLRGVRYTADSNINPSVIHQALMKFLSL